MVEHTIRVVDGRVPVMVGSGSNCTVTQIEKSRLYQSMGADALLLISPYYNKANAEGMYRHFAETADAVDIPCILYNVPGRTGCSIPVSVVERLARPPNIAGIKEASGDMSYAMKIAPWDRISPCTPATTTSLCPSSASAAAASSPSTPT